MKPVSLWVSSFHQLDFFSWLFIMTCYLKTSHAIPCPKLSVRPIENEQHGTRLFSQAKSGAAAAAGASGAAAGEESAERGGGGRGAQRHLDISCVVPDKGEPHGELAKSPKLCSRRWQVVFQKLASCVPEVGKLCSRSWKVVFQKLKSSVPEAEKLCSRSWKVVFQKLEISGKVVFQKLESS